MPSTIKAGFEKLRENLEITDLQEKTVSTRQENVRSAVEADMKILDSFLTGSYRRNTMIALLKEADVDVFMVLDPSYYSSHTPATLLERTKVALKKRYPETPRISPNGQAVTITFTDFKVDVVPGLYREGGGFLIPDSEHNRWISTDPKKHVDIWSASNKIHNGNLVPLIKMLKGWNKSRDVFRSFHLEVITLNVLTNIRIDDFSSGARYVFGEASEKIRVKLADPAGYNDDVAAHVDTEEKMKKIIERLEWASQTAKEAEALALQEKIAPAYEKWQAIFKGYFPAYGY